MQIPGFISFKKIRKINIKKNAPDDGAFHLLMGGAIS